jgi:hypothetical protein
LQQPRGRREGRPPPLPSTHRCPECQLTAAGARTRLLPEEGYLGRVGGMPRATGADDARLIRRGRRIRLYRQAEKKGAGAVVRGRWGGGGVGGGDAAAVKKGGEPGVSDAEDGGS